MRNFVLAIMLMGAAFAGGAVVNGPGLQWVKERIFNKPADEAGEAAIPEAVPQIVSGGIPDASVPALGSTIASREQADSAPKSEPQGTSQPAAAAAQTVRDERSKPAEPAPARGEAASKLPVALAQADAPAPIAALPPLLEAPVDTEAARTRTAEPPRAPEPPALKAPDAARARPPRTVAQAAGPWADAPDSGPAQAVPPRGYHKPVETDAAVAAASAASNDWAALRKQMQTLGVSRYGFEGEPNGKVRFHCVIPLAGRRAVGQQFEAEADDEFHAAQIALRRVALWQATENR